MRASAGAVSGPRLKVNGSAPPGGPVPATCSLCENVSGTAGAEAAVWAGSLGGPCVDMSTEPAKGRLFTESDCLFHLSRGLQKRQLPLAAWHGGRAAIIIASPVTPGPTLPLELHHG